MRTCRDCENLKYRNPQRVDTGARFAGSPVFLELDSDCYCEENHFNYTAGQVSEEYMNGLFRLGAVCGEFKECISISR